MMTILGGAMFEPARHEGFKKIVDQEPSGAHYSIWHIDAGPVGRLDYDAGMRSLRQMFPDAVANDENFVLFSTSGIHGTYRTIEEIEASIARWGDDDREADWQDAHENDGYTPAILTVLIVQPRIVCLRCGNVRVRKDDIPFLKSLRRSSLQAIKGTAK